MIRPRECPMCADDMEVHVEERPGIVEVYCSNCGAALTRPTEREAVSAWNRRAIADEVSSIVAHFAAWREDRSVRPGDYEPEMGRLCALLRRANGESA